MTSGKQAIFIIILGIVLGILRFFLLDDKDFLFIKKERVIEKIDDFIIPNNISSPMVVDLAFSKYYFDSGAATFIDARDPEDFQNGNINNSINIPYDYYEDYEDIIDDLDDASLYIIYCSGEGCSLSEELAFYLYENFQFKNLLIYEGGIPEWKNNQLPIE